MKEKLVKVYYCECGRSLERAAAVEFITGFFDNDFNKAEEEGRKIETVSLESISKIPWYCNHVRECPKWTESYNIRELSEIPLIKIHNIWQD